MVYRNEAADSGRKGAPSQTKQTHSFQMTERPAKGDFRPAYGGGQGSKRPEHTYDVK